MSQEMLNNNEKGTSVMTDQHLKSYMPTGYIIQEGDEDIVEGYIIQEGDEDVSLRCQPYPPFICPKGKDHCPKKSWRRNHIKEWFYIAAWQGCLPCVQHCIEVIGLDAQIESDNKKYTVMDWSQWAVVNNVEGAVEVVAYLSSGACSRLVAQTRLPSAESGAHLQITACGVAQPVHATSSFSDAKVPVPFEAGKHLCKAHKPNNLQRSNDPKYWFYEAVKHGCKTCVKFCVDRHGIDKSVASDNNGYTAICFASYSGDNDMLEFLKSL